MRRGKATLSSTFMCGNRRIALEHDAEVALLGWLGCDVCPSTRILPRLSVLEARDQHQRSSSCPSRSAQQCQELARLQDEADIADDKSIVAVGLPDAFDVQAAPVRGRAGRSLIRPSAAPLEALNHEAQHGQRDEERRAGGDLWGEVVLDGGEHAHRKSDGGGALQEERSTTSSKDTAKPSTDPARSPGESSASRRTARPRAFRLPDCGQNAGAPCSEPTVRLVCTE